MTHEERHQAQWAHHRRMLWVPFAVILLGVWLASSPAVLDYAANAGGELARVTAERDLQPIAHRAALMTWSDVVSGLVLVALGALWLRASLVWAPWLACAVGVWLLCAPVVFWAPSAAAFTNDSLVGILVIALTILIPGMPGMPLIMQHGPDVPPGWTYNPSSWLQRAPVIALGFAGFFAARHLVGYQMGYAAHAWDPFFGGGTARVLDSEVSRAWPVSDAALGVVAYTLEALMGFMGGPARWRTMPWMVLLFGILVVPLGLVSITLVVLQPVAVGAWCTICLFTAAAMLLMIPLTLDEVTAMVQFMVHAVRDEGQPLWRTFWLGGTVEGGGPDERSPEITGPLSETAPAMLWGVTVPWTLTASALIGLWWMAAPDVLGAGRQTTAADSSHLVGAAAVCIAVICTAEVVRAARLLNVPLGLWMAGSAWFLDGATPGFQWSSLVSGAALVLLSLPRGHVAERYGHWSRGNGKRE